MSMTRAPIQYLLQYNPHNKLLYRFSTTNASSLALRADEALFIITTFG